MSKVSKINILFLLVCFCFPTASFGAKFFKWTDEDGNIHYSDKAPVKQDSEAVHVNASQPSQSAKPPPKLSLEDEKESNPEEMASKEEQEKQLQEYCKNVQSNIKSLEGSAPVQELDDEGNRKFLTSEERVLKLEKYQKQYSERCNS